MSGPIKQILLVEDDQFLSSLLKKRLESEGLGVTLANDGQSALAALEVSMPDLLLLDIILPGISGFEVLEKLRGDEKTKTLPVIIISNLGQAEDRAKGKQFGVVDYFVKARMPLEELVKIVKTYIQNPTAYISSTV